MVRLGDRALLCGGLLTGVAALLHVAIIFGGPAWYRFFGAGERMARLAERGSAYPAVVTAAIAAALGVWTLYALSGAGVIGRLPLLRPVLALIAAAYLIRGAAGVPVVLLVDSPYTNELKGRTTFMLVSSAICIGLGLCYAAGAAARMQEAWMSSPPRVRSSASTLGGLAGPSGAASAPTPSRNEAMANTDSRVTIHMAASLDGFIARKDGRVDWMETSDRFDGGDVMAPESVAAFLETIDCYVMGSRTYETALAFEAKGRGWSYGDKPTFVLTRRALRTTRSTVAFYAGDLGRFVEERLRPKFRSIWFVGGGAVAGECLRRGLADELRYSILPVLIGDGVAFFDRLDGDVALHLREVKAYQSGVVALRYDVKR